MNRLSFEEICFRFQNSSLNQIQQEWFKISSHKFSKIDQVEDYMSSFKELSPALMASVMNMADANVSDHNSLCFISE